MIPATALSIALITALLVCGFFLMRHIALHDDREGY